MLWLYFDFADWLLIATIMVALCLYQGAMDNGHWLQLRWVDEPMAASQTWILGTGLSEYYKSTRVQFP